MGISVLFASGDQGVVGRTGKTLNGKYHPDFPAGSPYITAVGGTDLATKSVIGAEKAWSNGGAGFSDQFPAPEYQKSAVKSYLQKSDEAGLTPPASAFNRQGRAYPDVAALAGTQNAYCVAATSSFVGVGGTSAACPVTAGIFARLNAARAAKGKSNLGFLNPFIYQNPQAFNDVTEGKITGATGVKGFTAVEGWDAATGMGTPNFPKLMEAAMAAVPAPVPPVPPSPPSPAPTPPTPVPSGKEHYGAPPCLPDEMQATLQGAGSLCAPPCDKLGSCPTDVDPSCTKPNPQCILQDQMGNQYCGLACGFLGGDCPSGASCSSPLSGVCTYPDGTLAGISSNLVIKSEITV